MWTKISTANPTVPQYKESPSLAGEAFFRWVLDAAFYSDGGAESGQHGDKNLNHQSYDFLLSHRLKSLE